MTFYDRHQRALFFFDAADHVTAAALLAELVAEQPDDVALRLLLARAYYHSAQLLRAEVELREVIRRDPVESYARLMLGRTLQRLSRHDEAGTHLRIAAAMTG